jgi:radical SAM superfamily enzyme YgiQ (UPF0313 family)
MFTNNEAMRILYVMPTQYTPDGRLFKETRGFLPSLILPYLAGLTPKDLEVEIKNDYIEDINPVSTTWDLVGITISTLHSARGYELADRFMENGTPVFMGGVHASFMPEETLEHCNTVVIGEAENTLPLLIEDFRNGQLKERYQAGTLHHLKGLPNPRYDLIPFHKYRYRAVPVQTTRGCPHDCSYCTVTSFYGGRYRFRPVEEVIEELKAAIKTAKTRLVLFVTTTLQLKNSMHTSCSKGFCLLRFHGSASAP